MESAFHPKRGLVLLWFILGEREKKMFYKKLWFLPLTSTVKLFILALSESEMKSGTM